MANNRIEFGLTEVHYVPFEIDETGKEVYSTPVRLYGAISAEISPLGETFTHYSDNSVTFSSSTNNGYEGTITLDTLPPQFRTDVLGEKIVNGVLFENADAKSKSVALLFEIDGDSEATKWCFFNCSITRPTISSETKGEGVTVNANELSFVASPRHSDKEIRSFTSPDTPSEIKDTWYTKVWSPEEVAGVTPSA